MSLLFIFVVQDASEHISIYTTQYNVTTFESGLSDPIKMWFQYTIYTRI